MTGWTPVTLVKEHANSKQKESITIATSMAEYLKLSPLSHVMVFAGRKKCKATLQIKDRTNSCEVVASEALLKAIRLPSGISISVRNTEGGIRFGPFIAIMADERSNPPPFGEQNGFIAKLIKTASLRGYFAYVVTPAKLLNSGKTEVEGYRFSSQRWTRRSLPTPDVVYDRYLALTYSQQTAVSRAKRHLAEMNIPLFNKSVGSKWKVHKQMSKVSDLQRFLPETKTADVRNIEDMVRRYRTVYVKPAWGTQGRGVTKITKAKGPTRYTATIVRNDRTKTVTSVSIGGLLRKVKLKAGRQYIVQQGINLLTVGGKIADLRALVQRNDAGAWEITGVAARIGRPGSPVSNIHQGGSAMTCAKLLALTFGNGSSIYNQANKDIKELALGAAKVLDSETGTLGELGLDLGVDKKGKVWFIEANPRPGRTVFKMVGTPVMRSRAIVRPIEYAAFLADRKYQGSDGDISTGKEHQDV